MLIAAYIVHRCERAGRGQANRGSGSARRIGRRPATSFRKKTHRNVAERDARVVPGKRPQGFDRTTSSVFVNSDAQALVVATKLSGVLTETPRFFETKTCKRFRPVSGRPSSGALRRVHAYRPSLPAIFHQSHSSRSSRDLAHRGAFVAGMEFRAVGLS